MCHLLSYDIHVKAFRTSDVVYVYHTYDIYREHICVIHKHTVSFHIAKQETNTQIVKAMF